MSLLSYNPGSFQIFVKQEPSEALVVAKGKEKARKAIDPPPLVQLEVKPSVDPQKNYLQNPYLFMVVSLYKPDRDEPLPGPDSLTGTLSSSLHRLKDLDNSDMGLFVFGDVSVKMLGSYRLHFRLYEFCPDTFNSQYLTSVTSKKFSVLAPKDFRGMDQSSHISRLIADQGVRLRLRKEARAAAGSKRPFPYDSPVSIAQAHPPLPNEYSSSYEGEQSPTKREGTYTSNEVPSQSAMEQPYGAQPPYKRSYPSYPVVGQHSAINSPYSMMSHSSMVGHHASLINPTNVLASNANSAYPVDNTSLYTTATYPSSSSAYQGTSAQYPSTGYSGVYFNGYENNIPR
ncbi:velvet factor-domain-containing protein [Boeremia exigua]|uniref:velvet factor-domain-containing protein n=1 Tax=Boeremia exigua TaxID=749465 RepID=UPI001E8EB743|nr:velvet factor-domain-containing protein [Boeremia exigua]KAH6633340.1 velvet factor-domain-containing protein [Boeremia exigua]